MDNIAVCADCGWIGSDIELHSSVPALDSLNSFIKQAIAANNLEFRLCPACGSSKILYKRISISTFDPIASQRIPTFGAGIEGGLADGTVGDFSVDPVPQQMQESDPEPDLDADVVNDILATASTPDEKMSVLESLGMDESSFNRMAPEDRARIEQEIKVQKRRVKQEKVKRELERDRHSRPPPKHHKYTCLQCSKVFTSKVAIPDASNNGAKCPDCINRLVK